MRSSEVPSWPGFVVIRLMVSSMIVNRSSAPTAKASGPVTLTFTSILSPMVRVTGCGSPW